MHIDNFKNSMSIEEAITNIQNNSGHAYKWYPVKTKQGCVIELGGRNKLKEPSLFLDNLELKAYIIKLNDDGSIKHNGNNYSASHFSISLDEGIAYPTHYIDTPFKTNEKLIEWLDNKPNLNDIHFESETIYKIVEVQSVRNLLGTEINKFKI